MFVYLNIASKLNPGTVKYHVGSRLYVEIHESLKFSKMSDSNITSTFR